MPKKHSFAAKEQPRTSDYGVHPEQATREQATRILSIFMKEYRKYEMGKRPGSANIYCLSEPDNISQAELDRVMHTLNTTDGKTDKKEPTLAHLLHAIAAKAEIYQPGQHDISHCEQWAAILAPLCSETPITNSQGMIALCLFQGITQGMKPERRNTRESMVR